MICLSSISKHHCKHGLLILLFSSRTLTDAMLTVVYIWPLLPTDIHQSMSVWHRPRRPAFVWNWTLRLNTHNSSYSSAWAAAGIIIDVSTLPNRKEKKFVNNPQQLEGFRLYLLVFDVAAQSVYEQNFSPCFIPHCILTFDLFRTDIFISYTSKDSKSYKTIEKRRNINNGKDDSKISD